MSSPHENSLQSIQTAPPHGDVAPSDTEGQALIREAVEDYLEYLCAPLLGVVPYRQRRRLRAEAEDHLLALAEDYELEGFVPEEAVAVALREYGDPWQVGQSFADAWVGGGTPRRLSRLADAATLRAFGWFGVLTVLNLLLIEWSVILPSQLSLSLIEQCLSVASPVVAGALTGAAMHARTVSGVCRALAVLILAAAAVGVVLRPHQEGFRFALFQLVFWVPVGCLSATVAASLRRQFRLRGFRPQGAGPTTR